MFGTSLDSRSWNGIRGDAHDTGLVRGASRPDSPVASPRGLRLDETCVPVESAVHHPRFHIATHNGWNGSGRRGARVEPRLGRVRRTGVTTPVMGRGESSNPPPQPTTSFAASAGRTRGTPVGLSLTPPPIRDANDALTGNRSRLVGLGRCRGSTMCHPTSASVSFPTPSIHTSASTRPSARSTSRTPAHPARRGTDSADRRGGTVVWLRLQHLERSSGSFDGGSRMASH